MVPLRSGYPFFAQNESIEPRSVHTCLLGLVGVPRVQRAAVVPYCAARGRKPAAARANFRVLHGFCGDVLNLARARSRCAKFSTHAFMKLRFAKFSKFGAKFSTDGSIQVDLSAPQVSPWRPAAGLYCVPAVQSLHCALAVVCSAALSGLLRALCRPSQVSDCCVSSLCSALGLGLEPGTLGS